jgi:hypothetical protein
MGGAGFIGSMTESGTAALTPVKLAQVADGDQRQAREISKQIR